MHKELNKTRFYKFHEIVELLNTVYDTAIRTKLGYGLTQYLILYTVAHREPISQQEIATFLHLTAGTVSREVAMLREDGFLAVSDDDQDRRKQLLKLTPEGKKFYNEAYDRIYKLFPDVYKDVDEKSPLDESLDIIIKNLQDLREI